MFKIACSHTNTKKMNDVKVCLDCGLHLLPNGRVLFDKSIVNYKPKKTKKRKRR